MGRISRKRAAIYARYSSHNQRGESIEIQLDKDYAFCEANDLAVVGVFIDEAKTGRDTNRDDFQRLMQFAREGKTDYVVIYKVPRIMRNRDEMAMARIMLRECGVEILYAGEQIAEGSTGILQLGMLELLAEWESAVDSERILDGIEKNAERGMANGQPYYGWDITPDGYYSINEPEARILRTMKDMLFSGSTVAEIKRAMAPYRTRKGKPFSHNAITKLLKRRQNGGEYSYFGHVIPGGMPALWPMEEQEIILQILNKRSKPRKRSEEGEYALTGKLYHGGCDAPMVGTSGTGKGGATYYYYRCRSCRKTVRRDIVESAVAEAVVNALSNPATREKIADLMMELEQNKDVKPQTEVIKDELQGIELAYSRIWKAIEEGCAPPGGKERIDELAGRQKMLEDELRVAQSVEAARLERDRVLFWLENMAAQLDEQTIISVFVASVVLVDDDLHIVFTFNDDADVTNPLLNDGGGVFDQIKPCSTITVSAGIPRLFLFLRALRDVYTRSIHSRWKELPMNPSTQEQRPARIPSLLAGAFAGLFLIVFMMLWGLAQETSNLRRGFEEGFELRGTYSAIEESSGRYYRATFGYEEETWQIDWFDKGVADGTYVETEDPNYYLLHDADGVEVGWAHLTYATSKGAGLVYIQYDDEFMRLDKDSAVPAIVVQ